jgi:hypothetical protein
MAKEADLSYGNIPLLSVLLGVHYLGRRLPVP